MSSVAGQSLEIKGAVDWDKSIIVKDQKPSSKCSRDDNTFRFQQDKYVEIQSDERSRLKIGRLCCTKTRHSRRQNKVGRSGAI